MPQADVSISVVVKEEQKDETPTGDVSLAFKDNKVEDYNGPIRLLIPKGQSRTINVDHVTNLRILTIKKVSGKTYRLALRRAASPSTDLEVDRFFAADLCNVEQIKVTANDETDVALQILLVGIPKA